MQRTEKPTLSCTSTYISIACLVLINNHLTNVEDIKVLLSNLLLFLVYYLGVRNLFEYIAYNSVGLVPVARISFKILYQFRHYIEMYFDFILWF